MKFTSLYLSRLNSVLHKDSILSYTFFNYLDKGLAFLVPLSILYFFKDKGVYNTIEYIFSVASLMTIFLELGIKQYYFYAYKNSSDKSQLIVDVKQAFNFLAFCYSIIILVLFSIHNFDYFGIIFFFIGVRALYLMITSFLNYHFRLIDRPSLIFPITISINLGTIALLFLGKGLYFPLKLLNLFFIFPTIFVLLYGLKNFKKIEISKIKNFLNVTHKALLYSWPIILNVTLITFMNNYGKLYAYKFLSEDSMFQISFALRVSLIIHLAHASALGYLSKEMYMNNTIKSFWKSLFSYSRVILTMAMLLLSGIHLIKYMGYLTQFKITLTTYLIFLYVLIWCYQSYLELYFNRIGKTKIVLTFSIIAISLFFLCLFVFQINSILRIATIMIFSALVNLSLLLFIGVKRRVF